MAREVDFEQALRRACRVLEPSYALIGAVALLFHGYVRATADLGFVVLSTGPGWWSAVRTRAEKEGLQVEEMGPDFLRMTDRNRPYPRIDCIVTPKVAPEAWYYRQVVERAEERQYLDFSLRVATLEDLLALKLLSRRPKDRTDVSVILSDYRERLDWEYLRRTLRMLSGAIGRDLWKELEPKEDEFSPSL